MLKSRINQEETDTLKALRELVLQQTPTPMFFTFIQKDHQEKQNLQKTGASVCSTSVLQTGVSVIKLCVMGMIWLVLTGKKILQWVITLIFQVVSGGLKQVILIRLDGKALDSLFRYDREFWIGTGEPKVKNLWETRL